MALAAGTKVEVIGFFDNSANNPANPDPSATVRWGEQSWEEMMYGFLDVAIDARYPTRNDWFKKKLPASAKADE
jgi:hypothetical protein